MSFFPKTDRTAVELALTRNQKQLFDDITLERIEDQNESFLKPRININKMKFAVIIPLAIIGFIGYKLLKP
tara:strand:- start:2093 stop:2305 length:213 start_codon:yes stop_codon:yes gene_type:complete